MEKAIDDLRERSSANIVVDWPALKRLEVERSAKVHVHLWNASLRVALWTLFTEGHDVRPELDFDIEENVVTITKVTRRFGDVRVYDVRDLVALAVARRSALQAATRQPLTSAGAGNSLTDPPSPERISRDEGGYLAGLVGEMVSPPIWSGTGGDTRGTIDEWYGRLLIRASPMVQRQIEEFLRQMRESVNEPSTQPAPPHVKL